MTAAGAMTADHTNNDDKRRVQIALVLTATFMVVEVIGGILSGSLALLADAGHMLTDTMALTLAAVAFGVSARPADSKRSYGYHRFQILAAFVNGLSLLLIVGWILIEAVRRLISPPDVMGNNDADSGQRRVCWSISLHSSSCTAAIAKT